MPQLRLPLPRVAPVGARTHAAAPSGWTERQSGQRQSAQAAAVRAGAHHHCRRKRTARAPTWTVSDSAAVWHFYSCTSGGASGHEPVGRAFHNTMTPCGWSRHASVAAWALPDLRRRGARHDQWQHCHTAQMHSVGWPGRGALQSPSRGPAAAATAAGARPRRQEQLWNGGDRGALSLFRCFRILARPVGERAQRGLCPGDYLRRSLRFALVETEKGRHGGGRGGGRLSERARARGRGAAWLSLPQHGARRLQRCRAAGAGHRREEQRSGAFAS